MKIEPSKELSEEIEAEIQRAKASQSPDPNIADILSTLSAASGEPTKESKE